MKRLILLSIAATVAFAACSQSAEAQLFRRWRRNYYNGNYINRMYFAPVNAVPSYQTGANQVGVPASPTPTLAPRAMVVAPGTTTVAPRNTVPGVVGITPSGPVVGPVYGEPGDPRVLGDGTNAANRAASAFQGAGVRPAGSKVNEGTTVIDQP